MTPNYACFYVVYIWVSNFGEMSSKYVKHLNIKLQVFFFQKLSKKPTNLKSSRSSVAKLKQV